MKGGGLVIVIFEILLFYLEIEMAFQIINITMDGFMRILMFNSLFELLCFLCSNVYVTVFNNEIL